MRVLVVNSFRLVRHGIFSVLVSVRFVPSGHDSWRSCGCGLAQIMIKSFSPKLQIFVGATRRDLGAARQAVITAILEKGHIPSGMELWAAGNRPPLEVIASHLERCDAHILMVAARYGSPIEAPDGISFTEWEYRQSINKRPILPFVYDGASLSEARKRETDKRERLPATREKLDKLRADLLATKYVKEFRARNGLGELQKDAILAIDELQRSDDIPTNAGWIRGDSAEARTVRDIANNPFLRRELEQLRRFSTLGIRVGLDVGSKDAIAKAFWWNMQGRIRRRKHFSLFFESGSTTAFLSDEFVRAVVPGEGAHRWHIRTNNVLSLIHFDLHTSIDAARFPGGIPDPEDKYGAIFPNEWRELHEPFPQTPRPLHQGEKEAVEEMRKVFNQLGSRSDKPRPDNGLGTAVPTEHSLLLVLAAASGLDLDNPVQHLRGPHVGSHPNMLFKRAIFASGCPVVLFLSAEKLGNSFRKGKCYPVFGPDEPWAAAVKKYPLAVCVGYEWPKKSAPTPGLTLKELEERNRPEYILDCLKKLGFRVQYFDGGFPPIMMRRAAGLVRYCAPIRRLRGLFP